MRYNLKSKITHTSVVFIKLNTHGNLCAVMIIINRGNIDGSSSLRHLKEKILTDDILGTCISYSYYWKLLKGKFDRLLA